VYVPYIELYAIVWEMFAYLFAAVSRVLNPFRVYGYGFRPGVHLFAVVIGSLYRLQ
jgi:hypothetical protein